MISRNKIHKRIKRKNNPQIVSTLKAGEKNEMWRKVIQKISAGKRNYASVNLKKINDSTKEGDSVVIVGKVLGTGDLNKRIRICALSFSQSAIHKMKKVKAEAVMLEQEIIKNPKMEGIKLIA